MSIIYVPKGRAREYSPLAANFYNGCDHGCLYCYVPRIKHMTLEQHKKVEPRRDIIHQLERDCKKYYKSNNQVLLNFTGDPYCKTNELYKITREALKLFLEYKIPISILTKGGKRVLNDIEIIKKFNDNIEVGFTLTFNSKEKSNYWENGAVSPQERLETLKILKEENVKTWASFEPVIEPDESIAIMENSLPFVDKYKIGKINNYKGIDKQIDWTSFLKQAVDILRNNDKPFYVKHDLRQAATSVKLYGNEVLQDEFNISNNFI